MFLQIWIGTAAGVITYIILGALIIGGVYGLAADNIAGAEDIWEGVFAIGASLTISIMGAMLLSVTKLQEKWRAKLSRALNPSDNSDGNRAPGFFDRFNHLGEEYGLFVLPFITVLREGFEGVVFIAGAGLGLSVTSVFGSAVLGILAGALVGFFLYK